MRRVTLLVLVPLLACGARTNLDGFEPPTDAPTDAGTDVTDSPVPFDAGERCTPGESSATFFDAERMVRLSRASAFVDGTPPLGSDSLISLTVVLLDADVFDPAAPASIPSVVAHAELGGRPVELDTAIPVTVDTVGLGVRDFGGGAIFLTRFEAPRVECRGDACAPSRIEGRISAMSGEGWAVSGEFDATVCDYSVPLDI